jgi:hypothetical protein
MEATTLTIIETFTIEGDCELPLPPKEVLMNGLFALLLEIEMIMDKTLLKDPKTCLATFTSMETIRTLRNNPVAVTTKKHNLFY